MPPPARLLTLLRQAAALARATPGRRGRVVTLQDCTEVVVAGDLHGHVAHFQAILTAADLRNFPQRHFVVQEVVHGKFRYPGGGDKSHQLVDLFAALKNQYPKRVHYIPGNHELAQWTGRTVLKADEDLNALFRAGVTAAYGSSGMEVYAAYLDLFRSLPLVLRCPNGVLISHTLPASGALTAFDPARLAADSYEDADLLPGGTVHSLLWGRDTSQRNAEAFLRMMDAELLVTGHIACDEGYDAPNGRQLILDAAEHPAGYAVIPTDRGLTHAELVACVRTV